MEEFRRCFEKYEISNFGNCRRQLKGGEYTNVYGSVTSNGYRYFQVNRDNKRINKFFHHLVAQMFVGERPEKKVIDHIDRNKLNNNHSNLRYVTHKENMQNTDKYRHDILEQDKKKRHNILNKEYNEKKRRNLQIKPL